MEANKDLEIYKLAFELACKRLEILDKKLGGTCQLNYVQYENSFLNLAECCTGEEEHGDLD